MKKKRYFNAKGLIAIIIFCILGSLLPSSVLAQRISRGAGGSWSSMATWTGTIGATGTIATNSSSLVVTGTTSLFSTELTLGDPIFTNTGAYIGIVAAIGSDVSLTLFENAATTFSGAYLRTDNMAATASVPDATTTDVVIRAGHTVTLDQNADVRLLAARGSFTTDGTNRTFTINNNLLLLNGSNFDANNATLAVLGTTNINGTFQDTNATGTNTFSGLVGLNLGATWTTTAVTATSGLAFRGGLTVNGAFNAGAASFNAVAQTIGGGRLLTFANDVLLTAGSTVNNANFVSIAGILNGASAASQWTNIGTLNYSNTTLPMVVGVFNATSNGNTVAYTNTTVTQAVRATNYYNLNILNGTATNPKTFATTASHRIDGLLLIDNAQLTVTGAGKLETRLAQIGRNGLYVNATSSFPLNTTGFNSATNFTGKFDVMSADGGTMGNNNTFIYSSSGTDAIFQRGGNNGLYAVKTTNWATPPTAVIVKFQLNAKTISTQTNAAVLSIGNGFTNSITREASTARLQFNLDAATNQYSITHPDGGAATSVLQTGLQEVTWVINTSGAIYNYTAPNGTASTVGNGLADLWIGTTQIVNDLAIENPATAMNDIKFVYDVGSFTGEAHGANNPNQPSITINNLQIFTTTPPATSISGVINTYTAVSAINVAKTQLTVGSITGFSANDRVLVIQMKGASIDNATPATNANFGAITAYNNAGFYEITTVNSIAGSVVTLNSALINNYTVTGLVQMIRIPVLSNPTVDGLLTAQAWNGATGGVLVLEATNTLTLNADIDVSALGFRGGQISGSDGSCALGDYANSLLTYGQKGEGIATDVNDRARAKLANGGGGGNPHNSGGGGGGNFGAGALGARQWNCLGGGDTNNDCIDGVAAPGSELNGGQGGVALDHLAGNRVFMGGGGGSGQQNNTVGTSGANGGGIIIIIANSINANGYTMSAKGGSVFQGAGGDSGGGGGAGGCIFLSCPSYPTAINTNVQGGKGGDVGFASCHGNGGGGGGGLIKLSVPKPALMTTYQGGAPSSRNADGSDCATTANSFFCAGVAGTAGLVVIGLTILPVELVNFNARKQNHNTALLQWLTASEKDHDYFEIERSIDGTQFIALGRVKGKGNTSQASDYEYIDNKPMRGINYYRLKIVAQDGKFTYSHIKTLYFDDYEPIEMTLFPNPAKIEDNFVQIAFNEAIMPNEEIKIQLFDALGKAIATQSEKVAANQYKIIFVNRNELSIGLYMVNVHTSYGVFCKKMILQ